MVNYFVKFQAIHQDKIDRLNARLKDIEAELSDLWQKHDEAETKRNEFRKVLKIYIIEAQDLVPVGYYGTADPYAVAYFGNQKSRTGTVTNTLQPVWNELLTLYPFFCGRETIPNKK